jgi:RNA polymerase sigma-70 factor (ECF subfamily)
MKSIHNKEELALVKRCLDADASAQKEFYNRFAAKMFGVCLGYAKDYDTAKDLLQEGFIKIFQKLSKFDGEGSLEGWVRRIIVNNTIDYYRAQARKGSFLHLEDENGNTREGLTPSIGNEALRKIQIDEFLQITRQLPDGYRMILNLHIVEGLTHREIGDRLEISEGTSKSQFSKAKRFMAQYLGKYFDEETIASYDKRTS